MADKPKECPHCCYTVSISDPFCRNCGYKLHAQGVKNQNKTEDTVVSNSFALGNTEGPRVEGGYNDESSDEHKNTFPYKIAFFVVGVMAIFLLAYFIYDVVLVDKEKNSVNVTTIVNHQESNEEGIVSSELQLYEGETEIVDETPLDEYYSEPIAEPQIAQKTEEITNKEKTSANDNCKVYMEGYFRIGGQDFPVTLSFTKIGDELKDCVYNNVGYKATVKMKGIEKDRFFSFKGQSKGGDFIITLDEMSAYPLMLNAWVTGEATIGDKKADVIFTVKRIEPI